MRIERFEDIEAWQVGRELTNKVYDATEGERFARDFELKGQIRAAAGSSMHNVAEGFDGGSNAEFVRFLRYSQRSCREVQSQLYVARDRGYVSDDQFRKIYDLAELASRKCGGFIRYLQNHEPPQSPPSPNEEPRTTLLRSPSFEGQVNQEPPPP